MSSILSRLPNVLSSAPSSAPQEAMIASQKAHIEDLVQKTRTLEHTVKRLQDQLSTSRAEWQVEHKEWADGCNSLMACHRIAHLRTNVLLTQERVAFAHERELTRRERVAVIQRDYNLILFKAREKELELEADKLREEVRNAADGNVVLVAELKERLAEVMRELKEKATLSREAEKAREEAEQQASRVHTEHVALQAQLSSARTNVDRLMLRLEDAQTALAEKERSNNELQQEKATLKAQVGKWKSLDDRGGAEVEELHKRRAALETQIKHLESRVSEEQKKALAHEKAFQKEHKKIEKLQQALEEQTRIAEGKSAAEANQRDEAEDAKVNKKLQKLTTALEEQAEKTAKAEEEAALLEEQSRHYKDELDKALKQIEKLRANSQADVSTSRSRVQSGPGPDEAEIINPPQSESSPSPATGSNLAKAGPSRKKPTPSGIALIPLLQSTYKLAIDGGDKPTAKKVEKGKDAQKSKPSTSDKKGKRKAPEDDGTPTIESVSDDRAPRSAKLKTERKQTRTGDSQRPAVDVDVDDAVMPKKKRLRKLNVNIFASAKPDSLDWANQFNLVGLINVEVLYRHDADSIVQGVGGLNIPTELSPVKVPARSLAGRSTSASIRKG
ncbi:hypothetical protein BJV78DRAFT_1283333 [Lactifluus subvellereus]|nr:hypothetical protein BJV78DRAFT_1283333 [Lactifluus subvellereus]